MTELQFYVALDTNIIGLEWKKQTQHNKSTHSPIEINVLQHKKLKPGLVASYDIQHGKGEGLFLSWHFVNLSLTYSLRHLPTYLQLRTHTG